MEAILSYLTAAMIAWIPLHAHAPFEASDDVLSRYESIVRDVVEVAFDEGESPLYGGEDGRMRTALMMLSVASFESGYRKRVDEGQRRGDHGRSYCLMQIQVGNGTTREGWTGRDLVTDRRLCFRAALHILQDSLTACRRLAPQDRLSKYASGRCFENAEVSRTRVDRAWAWLATHAAPRPAPEET
jgi:hypothetical protein